jgi:hypothetical protein
LSGALLGGAISSVLNRQQMKDARQQRAEQARRDQHQCSIDRRFSTYADFYTCVRAFRNALRPGARPAPRLPMDDISALARPAYSASSLVFLTVEDPRTRTACGDLARTMSEIQGILDDPSTTPAAKPCPNSTNKWQPQYADSKQPLEENSKSQPLPAKSTTTRLETDPSVIPCGKQGYPATAATRSKCASTALDLARGRPVRVAVGGSRRVVLCAAREPPPSTALAWRPGTALRNASC